MSATEPPAAEATSAAAVGAARSPGADAAQAPAADAGQPAGADATQLQAGHAAQAAGVHAPSAQEVSPALRVLHPGPFTTVQDGGRPGLAHLGVPHSGAADRAALALANHLLGNARGAAGLEMTAGGLRLEALGTVAVALTGAPAPATVDDLPVAMDAPFLLHAGAVLSVGAPERGLRTYLGVRGGIAVPVVLGSRSRDVLSALGPEPLRPQDRLPVGRAPAAAPQDATVTEPPAAKPVLQLLAAPRAELLVDGALDRLCTSTYRVTDAVDRVGVRLSGPALRWRPGARSATEGVVEGAVQVPPDGQPLIFLADHPVTGGYPVLAVLTQAAVGEAAQLRPGMRVRFRRRAPH